MHRIALAGLMGSGKSTIGPLLAHTLGVEFVDTDTYLNQTYGPVEAIFDRPDAAEEFQRIERQVVNDLSARDNVVISTGGRTLLDIANRNQLLATCFVVCLDATDDELLRRLALPSDTFRPRLEQAEDTAALISKLRVESRAAFDDLPTVHTTGRPPSDVVTEVVALHQTR